MQSFLLSVLAAATFGLVTAAPAPVPRYVARHHAKSSIQGLKLIDGDVKPNSYIVKLSDTADREKHLNWVSGLIANSTCTNKTEPSVVSTTGFRGYAAELDDDAVSQLIASDAVEWVEEDGIMRALATQNDAPWGLARISQVDPLPRGSNPRTLDFTYEFADNGGEGVDVYVIDTGIRTTHQDFGGRATMVFTAGELANTDDNGHGSHCAGTVGGTRFGVAKSANILGVKVLDADGSGATSDILAGINFAIDAAQASKKPSVISMSLGGAPSRALDNAVQIATQTGVHVVVAAGNENQNAGNVSPARVQGIITVGASDINDQRAVFSNFGTAVDIFAPGVAVTSVGITSDRATQTLDGTSMACPHVAGVVAAILSQEPTLTPAQMQARLTGSAINGVIKGLPTGTRNRFAHLLPEEGAPGSETGPRDGNGLGGDDASSGSTGILPKTTTGASKSSAGASA